MSTATTKTAIEKIEQFILDTIFPIKCLNCNKEGFWICEKCFEKIQIKDEQICGICEKVLTPDGRTCLHCKKTQTDKNFLDGLIVCSTYSQNQISKAVHIFKYRFVSNLHEPLGNLMIKVLRKTDFQIPSAIAPVPLHQRRLRWRGFNQSSLLAKHIAANLLPGISIEVNENLLIRNRYTTPQMGINDYGSRTKNISGAFSISDKKEEIKNKTFLLVDDIATTGSTIFECAKTLKQAGAKEVFAIVIARQESKSVRHGQVQ